MSSSAECFCAISTSASLPSQRRVQFSLAQFTQKPMLISGCASNVRIGVSSSIRPPNQ